MTFKKQIYLKNEVIISSKHVVYLIFILNHT